MPDKERDTPTTTPITIMTTTEATDSAALYRLMAWLSPSYPVGAFTYSHGLEWLVETGEVRTVASLIDWLEDILTRGGGRNDAVLFACAWRAASVNDMGALLDIADHGLAVAGSAERHLEATAQGWAFVDVTCRTWESPTLECLRARFEGEIPYPVAVGVACADHGIPLAQGLHAYGHALAANLISAGVRLIPLGHSDGQRALKAIEACVHVVAEAAPATTLADLSGTVILADIAAMKHETQYTRLFRS